MADFESKGLHGYFPQLQPQQQHAVHLEKGQFNMMHLLGGKSDTDNFVFSAATFAPHNLEPQKPTFRALESSAFSSQAMHW
jgi:hypothetical protein